MLVAFSSLEIRGNNLVSLVKVDKAIDSLSIDQRFCITNSSVLSQLCAPSFRRMSLRATSSIFLGLCVSTEAKD